MYTSLIIFTGLLIASLLCFGIGGSSRDSEDRR